MIGLIFGETNFPIEILKKIKKKLLRYLIIDLTTKNKFSNDKNSYPVSMGQVGKILRILKENNCKKVEIDDFISSSIKSIYQLVLDKDQIESWKKYFTNDEVYLFEFNYREDYEGDDAFLISLGPSLAPGLLVVAAS